LVREKSFWNSVLPFEESQLLNRHILEHHVDLELETSLDEINSDGFGNVKSIKTDKGEIIECDMVALTVGVSPNVDFLKNSTIDIGIGVKVNRFLETNIKDIYALGDCAEQRNPNKNRKNIEAIWYTGKMMGETLAQTICGKPMEYNPGNWFNSAKFFDIEYQTYGWVFSNPTENEAQFYWEHQSGKIAIRISYDKNNRVFFGINTFGIRMKHAFFDTVLNNKETVDYVLKNLKKANFDPEFFKRYENEIFQSFQINETIVNN
jgi:NADPH-dependent 2,4-dienoyl-CoA reductase/sulfur reductase-like enzyme